MAKYQDNLRSSPFAVCFEIKAILSESVIPLI